MPNPLHSTNYGVFRELLVKARLSSGITQVELAKQLDKPQSYVSKYERGERRIDLPEFVELAEILGLDTTAFIEEYRKAVKK